MSNKSFLDDIDRRTQKLSRDLDEAAAKYDKLLPPAVVKELAEINRELRRASINYTPFEEK